jgi:hypothetical protein
MAVIVSGSSSFALDLAYGLPSLSIFPRRSLTHICKAHIGAAGSSRITQLLKEVGIGVRKLLFR